ncbi:MAG: protein kinase [Planctomycetales bacterium]|nr:protein kinase [Planctomycetales bacterium]
MSEDESESPAGPSDDEATLPLADGNALRSGSTGDDLRDETQYYSTSGKSINSSGEAELDRLGPYQLIEELARGGMGVVYRAFDTRLQRTVALKTILTGNLASGEEVQRFRIEAEASAKLDHPHIVPIYEVGQHDRTHFFVMKYLPGGNLADQLSAVREDPRRAAQLLLDVACAVEHAHQRGILHRDLKPQNIMLDEHGQPYVTDFGLAKFSQPTGPHESDSGLTRTGAILGTPSYMAPEQALGQIAVTTACDIYALGAILYESITGQRPYQGKSAMDTVLLVMRGELIPPRQVNPAVPAELALVCQKCLAKDPADRYSTAAELASDLQAFLNGEPISVAPPTWRGLLALWLRRHARVAASTAVTGMLFGAILSSSWWLALTNNPDLPYERLPSVQRLAMHRVVPEFVIRNAMLGSLVSMSMVGLVATLLGRQKDMASDLVVGLTVGLIMTMCVLPVAVCGPFQTFALPATMTDLDLLLSGSGRGTDVDATDMTERYPDMHAVAPRERRVILARKILEDLMSNLVITTAITVGVSLAICLSVSMSSTLLAGALWRRAERARDIIFPYVELSLPMSLFAILATLPLLGGLAGMSVTGFFGSLFNVVMDGRTVFVWLLAAMGTMLAATALAWRASSPRVRVASQACWITCFALGPLILGHNPDVYYNSAFDVKRHLPVNQLPVNEEPCLYWTDATNQQVVRCTLDGSQQAPVLVRLNRPRGLAIVGSSLFVSDYGFGQIVRRDLRTNKARVVIANAPGVRGIAIDAATGKVYWSDRDLKMVLRANLDGSQEEVLISEHLAYPYTIQLDPMEHWLFVEDHLAGAIFRARWDGSEMTRFADVSSTTENRPGGMALDIGGRAIYYKDAKGRRILRAALDGGETTVVLDQLVNPNGLCIDPVAGKIYWAESAIWRANLDGTNKQMVDGTQSSFIAGICIVHP